MAATKKANTKKTAATAKINASTKKKTAATTATKKTEQKPAMKTVTINGRKVKVEEKRSSRYNAKGDRVQKKCSVCGNWQPLEKFYRPEKDCRCKDCSGAYAKQLKEQKEAEAAEAEKAAKKTRKRKTAAVK